MTEAQIYQLNNGVSMPAIGLGVYQSGPQETVAAVATALRTGYRLIDTAAAYFNEAEVGEAVRQSGVPRDEIFVTTKLWVSDYGYDGALHAFDRSMRKLGLDTLDLYLLHWPVPDDFERTMEAWRAAERLLDEGRTRAIGVCNFQPQHLETLEARSAVTPAVNQVELHPYFSQAELRAIHERLGIRTQAWSPIGGVDRYAAGNDKSRDALTDPVIARIAAKYGKTPAQVVLRWHLEHDVGIIPKSVKPERIAENFAVFEFALAPEDLAAIDALDTGERGGPDPEAVDREGFGLRIGD